MNEQDDQRAQAALDFFAEVTRDFCASLPPVAAKCVQLVAQQQGEALAAATGIGAQPATAPAPVARESVLAKSAKAEPSAALSGQADRDVTQK